MSLLEPPDSGGMGSRGEGGQLVIVTSFSRHDDQLDWGRVLLVIVEEFGVFWAKSLLNRSGSLDLMVSFPTPPPHSCGLNSLHSSWKFSIKFLVFYIMR